MNINKDYYTGDTTFFSEFTIEIEKLFNKKINWKDNCSGELFYAEDCERYIHISTNIMCSWFSATIYYGEPYGHWKKSFTNAKELHKFWYSMRKETEIIEENNTAIQVETPSLFDLC